MGCSVDICSTTGLSMGCRGISVLAPGVLPRFLLLTLMLAELFLTLVFLFLLSSIFPPFLLNTSPRGTTILAARPRWALRWGNWSQLELAEAGMGQPRLLLTEATHAVSPLPTPSHLHPIGFAQSRLLNLSGHGI